MMSLVSSALCPLSDFTSLSSFSMLCPPLGILVPFYISWGSLSLSLTDCVLCLYSCLEAIHSKIVWFLFHLCRFTFCHCAWSSLFSVIIIAQGVATCPPLTRANLLRQLISSITSWMKYFLHDGGCYHLGFPRSCKKGNGG